MLEVLPYEPELENQTSSLLILDEILPELEDDLADIEPIIINEIDPEATEINILSCEELTQRLENLENPYPSYQAGIDVQAENAIASEVLVAGNWINIFNDAGVRKIRKADASNNRPAHGFILEGIASGDPGVFYASGVNSQLSGLNSGATYFISADTPGAVTDTMPPLTAGNLVQFLGYAASATSLRFEYDEPIYVV